MDLAIIGKRKRKFVKLKCANIFVKVFLMYWEILRENREKFARNQKESEENFG